jgi:hypothetical protein
MFKLLKRFIDWLKKIFSDSSNNILGNSSTKAEDTPPKPKQKNKPQNLNVRIIGPRGCGKTTYFGAVLACPNRNREVIKNIMPIGPKSSAFEDKAINILAEGGAFEPTDPEADLKKLQEIQFSVAINCNANEDLTLIIVSKDYPGEIFDGYNALDSETQQMYITDCQASQAIFLLLEATQYKQDFDYAITIRKFFHVLIESMDSGWKGRIAFALTKCEQLPMYVDRLQCGSEGLIEKYFPKTLNTLKDICYNKEIEIEYFSMSAFGMRGNMFEGNVIMKPSPTDPTKEIACIHYPKAWKPFGLFTPLYWLATGDRFPPKYED